MINPAALGGLGYCGHRLNVAGTDGNSIKNGEREIFREERSNG